MRILFAASDRDLTACYSLMLSGENEVTTAFDAPQVIGRVADRRPDIVILESRIPRMDIKRVASFLKSEDIPVIVLTERRVNRKMLLEDIHVNAYLSFPFEFSELNRLIKEVAEKRGSNATIEMGDARVDVSRFMLSDTVNLTNQEINMLHCAANGVPPEARHPEVYVGAINAKLERLGKRARIRYIMNEGYRLVTGNE